MTFLLSIWSRRSNVVKNLKLVYIVILRIDGNEESFRLCRFSEKDPSLTLSMIVGVAQDDI